MSDESQKMDELLAASKDSDEAFGNLITAVYPRLRVLVRRRMPNRAHFDEDDIIQEALVRRYDKRSDLSFESENQFFAYVSRLVQNISMQYYRRRQRRTAA